jgi:hypothetical protein
LDQPVQAKVFCKQISIDNWRRGLAYANLADYCVEHGYTNEAKFCLNRVEEVVQKIEAKLQQPDEISWRRNHLNAMIAKTRLEITNQGVKKASKTENDLFSQQIEDLDELIKLGEFEGVKSALKSYVELFGRYYDNTERRQTAEHKIKAFWEKIPIVIRLELLMSLAQASLDHSDQATALRLVNNAQIFLDDYAWTPEYLIPLSAQVAKLRFLAGDKEKAQKDIDAANTLYDIRNQEIMSIYRCNSLLPLAEAMAAMNDTQAALSVYKKALDAGSDNPNGRPRAEDLSAVCRSMALSGIEPTSELWMQIRQIHEGLSDPW